MASFSCTRLWVCPTTSEPYRLLLSEEKLRESTGFQELWSIGLPLVQLCHELDGVLRDLVGSISQSKMTWLTPIDIYFHWSDIKIWFLIKNRKSGSIARFTAWVRDSYENLDFSWEIGMSFCFVVTGLTLLFWVIGKSFRVSDFESPLFRKWHGTLLCLGDSFRLDDWFESQRTGQMTQFRVIGG
jgi:hypothetical protein